MFVLDRCTLVRWNRMQMLLEIWGNAGMIRNEVGATDAGTYLAEPDRAERQAICHTQTYLPHDDMSAV
jgi:hypothetical protein